MRHPRLLSHPSQKITPSHFNMTSMAWERICLSCVSVIPCPWNMSSGLTKMKSLNPHLSDRRAVISLADFLFPSGFPDNGWDT